MTKDYLELPVKALWLCAMAIFLGAAVVGCDSQAEKMTDLGEELYDRTEFDKAIETYQKAIELDPEYTRAHKKLASVYKRKDMYRLALDAYYQAFEIDPEDVGLYYKIARAHIHQYRKSKDLEQLAKCEEMIARGLDDRLAQRDPELIDNLNDLKNLTERIRKALARSQKKKKKTTSADDDEDSVIDTALENSKEKDD